MKNMISKGRKMVALLFCCAACVMMLELPVYAVCTTHVWDDQSVFLRARYADEEQCWVYYQDYKVCRYCKYQKAVGGEYSYKINHAYGNYSATCNGKMQTIQQRCAYCKHIRTIVKICPAGPHTGNCTALPVSIQPGELMK